MKVHPVAEIFPMIPASSEEFLGLVDSIHEEGLREPIVMHNGQLVDGRNRLAACKAANVQPRFVEWEEISNGKDLLGWIFSRNYHRRHLTEEQRVMVHTEFNRLELEQIAEKNKEQARFDGSKAGPGRGKTAHTNSCEPLKRDSKTEHARSTVGKVAAAAGVSHHKAAQAVALDKAAQVDPEAKAAQEAVKAGTMPLREAIKKIKKPAPTKKQASLGEVFAKRWRKFMDSFAVADHAAVRALIKIELEKY